MQLILSPQMSLLNLLAIAYLSVQLFCLFSLFVCSAICLFSLFFCSAYLSVQLISSDTFGGRLKQDDSLWQSPVGLWVPSILIGSLLCHIVPSCAILYKPWCATLYPHTILCLKVTRVAQVVASWQAAGEDFSNLWGFLVSMGETLASHRRWKNCPQSSVLSPQSSVLSPQSNLALLMVK